MVAAAASWVLARRVVRQAWPEAEGALRLKGLEAPVTVVTDRYGVPHIYAQTQGDLFFTQGFVHARDRFWGMELNRRRGRGTLAELLNNEVLTHDQGWKALQLPDFARQELAKMDPESRFPLDAYAAGVNAWLAANQGRLPLEFTILRWRGHEADDPAPWTAEDSLIVAMVVCWRVGAPRIHPSIAAEILERVGPKRGSFLMNGEQDPSMGSEFGGVPGLLTDLSLHALANGTAALPGWWSLHSQVVRVEGDKTERGAPLLAVDLPTDLYLPTPWYVMTWHVGDGSRQPSHSNLEGAAGASLPGTPGLVVGTDDRAVWAVWSNPQYALLSLLKELAPSQRTLPWQRWLLAALLDGGRTAPLADKREVVTKEELGERQMDVFSARAAKLVPFLLQVEPEGWRQERVTGMLQKWDYRVGDNNKESPFFAVYQLELARAAFADELGDGLFEAYAAQSDAYQAALDTILSDPGSAWWDDVTTPERELRRDILERAYEPALEWMGRNYGDLHMLWEWGIVHGSRLFHLLGNAWPWDQLLNHDLRPDGWYDTIKASPGGLPCLGDACSGGDQFRAKAVYGYRQIVDANDPSTVWFLLLPGQSGHPFHPHYDDLRDEWIKGEYLPLRLAASPEEVEGMESVLVLEPVD